MASPQVKSVKDLAFNGLLVAYDFGYPERVPNQLLAVKTFQNAPCIDYISTNQFTSVPNIQPTQAELAVKADSLTGLWIGMWSPTPPGLNSRSIRRHSSVEQNSGYPIINHDPKALRVIAANASKAGRWYHCLVDGEDGLCTALPVNSEDVYFFAEYRDDITIGVDTRKDTWHEKVVAAYTMHRNTLQSMGNELSVQPENSPTQEIDIDTNMQDAATNTTGGATAETGPPVVDQNNPLYRLATSNAVLSLAECTSALQALETFAPVLKDEGYTSQNIRDVSEGLVEAKIVLDFRNLRPFTVLFLMLWARDSEGTEDTALNTMDCMGAMFTSRVVDTQTSILGFRRYLTGEINKLRSVVVSSKTCARKLRSVGSEETATILLDTSCELKSHMRRLEGLLATLPKV